MYIILRRFILLSLSLSLLRRETVLRRRVSSKRTKGPDEKRNRIKLKTRARARRKTQVRSYARV